MLFHFSIYISLKGTGKICFLWLFATVCPLSVRGGDYFFLSMCFKFQLFLWCGAVTARVPGGGGEERAPLSEGPLPPPTPPLPPPHRFTHLVPSALMKSSQLYAVYVIVFWYVKKDQRSPISHLCLIFCLNLPYCIFTFCTFSFIERQQQERQGGGGGGGPPLARTWAF